MSSKSIFIVIFLTVLSSITIGFVLGGLYVSAGKNTKEKKVSVCGYTKIEYGLAVNCKGDTIVIKEGKQKYRLEEIKNIK